MANRARIKKPFYLVGQSMGATFQAPWLNVEGVDNLSFQATWTSADAVGVFSVQGTNDEAVVNASTRAEEPSGRLGPATIHTVSSGNPASNNSSIIIPLTDRAERWVRVVYTRTSGTGTTSVGFTGKGI